jgi:hypothetical protein
MRVMKTRLNSFDQRSIEILLLQIMRSGILMGLKVLAQEAIAAMRPILSMRVKEIQVLGEQPTVLISVQIYPS